MTQEHGPSEEEWAQIRVIQADIVNLAYHERYEASVAAGEELVALMVSLRQKYGRLAALLAIHAEHVNCSSDREVLLHDTYRCARATGAAAYEAWAAQSLAWHYVNAAPALTEAERWLSVAESLSGGPTDERVLEDLAHLRGILRSRRMGPRTPKPRRGRRTRA